MNTFELGRTGEEFVRFGLDKVFKDTRKVPDQINEQLLWGDLVVKGSVAMGLSNIKVEVKTESKHTGNLFWEWWSNKSTQRKGWGQTSPADELYYLFWDDGVGYRLPNLQHSKWIVDYYCEMSNFPFVQQKKNIQKNDSWGYLIPVEWFIESNDAVRFEFDSLKEEWLDTKKPASED